MAVKTRVSAQALVLRLKLGEDKNGKISFKNLVLKGLKPDAYDAGILEVANALKGILPYELDRLSKETSTEIREEEV